ncbi:uncharacterized protein [Aegilops tauschii subsp. strangulata]|uniref:Uncharacterized protein n=1 Tax=Aegilops tauschii TaxID=37682 RepID=M8BVE3_AEGTA|nr:uncharacterized protein LOC109773126 [Aegilops tauschii subsp. strangulata]
MARTTTMRVATVCMLLLLLVSTATATATESPQRRDLAEEGTSPSAASPSADGAPADKEPPEGHLGFRVVTGLIEKATGKSARLDLEQEENVH